LQELSDVLPEGLGGAPSEAERCACDVTDLMSGDVADNAGQFFFEIWLRLFEQFTECLRNFCITFDVNRTAAYGGFRRRAC
jgi:hypothetical protein